MLPLIENDRRPGLLVSVRNANEAQAAMAGGAQVIDIKEPEHGSLGAAAPEVIASVIRVVDGRTPVTAAAGELVDLISSHLHPLPSGLSYFKIGLSACREIPNWREQWLGTMKALWPTECAPQHTVAVVYADWLRAKAPQPIEVLEAAIETGCPALLVDTWDKSAGGLFDHWPEKKLIRFIESVQANSKLMVLAGSLVGASFSAAARLGPDLLAVRTAACESGRTGTVSQERVASLNRAISSARIVAVQ